MEGITRETAVETIERIVSAIESDPMPVPVSELWAYGDVVVGLDPVPRVELYLSKDLLFKDSPEAEPAFEESHGIAGVGKTVAADWARRFPQHLRGTDEGHADPVRCLGAQLLAPDQPVHLEVGNASFENSVRQRLRRARESGDWERVLDPRAACLWATTEDGGQRSPEALERLLTGSVAVPTLARSLRMLDVEETAIDAATSAIGRSRDAGSGASVSGDIV